MSYFECYSLFEVLAVIIVNLSQVKKVHFCLLWNTRCPDEHLIDEGTVTCGPVCRQRLGRYIPAATNIQATIG
jgi:hypothetical protein